LEKPVVRGPKIRLFFYISAAFFKSGLEQGYCLVCEAEASFLTRHRQNLRRAGFRSSGRPDIPFIQSCEKWLKDAGFLSFEQISVKVKK
jgi:hypothetical protein